MRNLYDEDIRNVLINNNKRVRIVEDNNGDNKDEIKIDEDDVKAFNKSFNEEIIDLLDSFGIHDKFISIDSDDNDLDESILDSIKEYYNIKHGAVLLKGSKDRIANMRTNKTFKGLCSLLDNYIYEIASYNINDVKVCLDGEELEGVEIKEVEVEAEEESDDEMSSKGDDKDLETLKSQIIDEVREKAKEAMTKELNDIWERQEREYKIERDKLMSNMRLNIEEAVSKVNKLSYDELINSKEFTLNNTKIDIIEEAVDNLQADNIKSINDEVERINDIIRDIEEVDDENKEYYRSHEALKIIEEYLYSDRVQEVLKLVPSLLRDLSDNLSEL